MALLPAHLLVLGHHDGGVVVVILDATVCTIFQQEPHGFHLTPPTGAMQSRVPTIGLAVHVTATLPGGDRRKGGEEKMHRLRGEMMHDQVNM